MNIRNSLSQHSLPVAYYVLVLGNVFFAPFAGAAFGNSDSTTTKFVNRVSQCYASDESNTFLQECGLTYAVGVANAIRLFSTPPTKVSLDTGCNSVGVQVWLSNMQLADY